MVHPKLRERFTCQACGIGTSTPMLCGDCFDMFAASKRSHPSVLAPMAAAVDRRAPEVGAADDVELWDQWALLGDVGDRLGRSASP